MAKGGGGEPDQGMTIILLMALLGAAAYGVWYFLHPQIIDAVRFLRVLQLMLIDQFADTVYMPDGSTVTPRQLHEWLSSNKANNLSWEQIATVSTTIVPQFFRWPTVLVLLAMAWIGHKFAPRRKMRHAFNLEGLIHVQAEAWPIITPITKLNPATGQQRAPGAALPARLPPFAEALAPEEFIAFNHIPYANRQMDTEAAARIFTRQLGPRWQSWDKLPLHYQVIGAALALKGARKREDADHLFAEIAVCWDPKGGLQLSLPLMSRIKQLLKDPKVGGEAAKVMAGHAFVVPGMLRLLLWSRERGGVLASASFLWLRAVDRNLWYAMNSAGRRTFHSEAAGAVAHYFAEKFLRRPLILPKVQSAVDALVDYMKEHDPPIPQAAEKPAPRAAYHAPRAASAQKIAVQGGRA
jgi:intracellular multiplication protein IcmP